MSWAVAIFSFPCTSLIYNENKLHYRQNLSNILELHFCNYLSRFSCLRRVDSLYISRVAEVLSICVSVFSISFAPVHTLDPP